MVKKLFIVCLLVIFGCCFSAYAATNARKAQFNDNINSTVAVTDVSSGDTQEVDSDGSASVKEYPKKTAFLRADGTIVSGACTVYGVSFEGSNSGDRVYIYDSNAALGDTLFRIKTAVNEEKNITIPGGITFATDVYVDITSTSATCTPSVTVYYDN